MHEGHKQLAALNNKKSSTRSRGIGKLAKDLKSAKNKRPLISKFPPQLVRTTGYHHSGLGRFVGTPPSVESVQENDLRKNIRAIGRARKRTKRYNKVLKATRGRLSTGNHLPRKARKTIAEFATGAGNYNNNSGSGKSGGSSKSKRWFEGGKRRKTRHKKRRTKRRRRKRRKTKRKKR